MEMNRKIMTKPLAIIKNNKHQQISATTKSSSTSSPLSSSSSSAASSSSSATSPPTTIQTLIVRPTNARLNSSSSSTTPPLVPPLQPPQQQQQSAKLVSGGGGGRQQSTAVKQSSTGSQQHHHNNNNNVHIPSDILDDLASRFIINVPDDERNNLIRICFQIELAQWFYLDFFCAIDDKKLIPCGMKQFAIAIFKHIPFLKVHLPNIDKILEDWKQYKLTVPTYGAILMSEDLKHVLLVQSFWAKSSWGFPKGKVNEHEAPIHCATREVFEETGYDITDLIIQTDYIEAVINYQYTRLYLVRNVPLKTQFMPRTRKEIKCCEWFPIDSLPTNKNDGITKQNLGINANSFFMIIPFIKRLKKWANEHRNSMNLVDLNGVTTGAYPKSSKQQQIGIYNYNNSLFPVAKKFDSKLSFKTTTTPTNTTTTINNTTTAPLNIPQTIVVATTNTQKLSSNKRQRHKSMGDLDGNMINNNHNNKQQRQQQQQLPLNDDFLATTIEQQQQQSQQINTNNNNTNNKKLIRSNNFKRRQFSSVSGIMNDKQSYPFDLIKQNDSSEIAINPMMTMLMATTVNKTNNNNNGNSIESSSNNLFNNAYKSEKKQALPSKLLLKDIKKSQKNSNNFDAAGPAPPPIGSVHFKQVLSKSPNFNSWTNFSFRKNYIANVFC